MVPVLSRATAFTLANASITRPPFNKIPCLDALPIPEKNASGTLSTNAHGQEITRNVKAV